MNKEEAIAQVIEYFEDYDFWIEYAQGYGESTNFLATYGGLNADYKFYFYGHYVSILDIEANKAPEIPYSANLYAELDKHFSQNGEL